jgi:hypothetical protein
MVALNLIQYRTRKGRPLARGAFLVYANDNYVGPLLVREVE